MAEQQRALAAQIQNAAAQRESESENNALLNTAVALLQATQTYPRNARSASAPDAVVATNYAEPGLAIQPTYERPAVFPTSTPVAGDYTNTVRLALPPEPPEAPLRSPGVVTYTYTYAPVEPHLYESYPQVLTAGYYGYQSRRFGELRTGQFNGRQERR